MKYIFWVFVFFIVCAQSSIAQTDREHDGFIGPVKKVFVEWSPISGSKYPTDTHCRQMTNVYNESGRIMQHSVYPGSCGEDENRDYYTYSQDGSRITKSQEIIGKESPSPPPTPASRPDTENNKDELKTTFKYNSVGKQIEKTAFRSGRVLYKYTYNYDSKGRIIETTGYDAGGQISSQLVYIYSGVDLFPSESTYYGRNGKWFEKIVYSDYEFNSYGDWVKRKEISEKPDNRNSISLKSREIQYYSTEK